MNLVKVDFDEPVADIVRDLVTHWVSTAVGIGATRELVPVFILANSVKEEIQVVGADMGDTAIKREALAHIIRDKAKEMRADLLFSALEAYYLALENLEDRDKYPDVIAGHPAAKEAITFQVETKLGTWAAKVDITNSGSGRKLIGAEHIEFKKTQTGGRFSNFLFDKFN